MSDKELDREIEVLAMHVCCYTEDEVLDLFRRVREQGKKETT